MCFFTRDLLVPPYDRFYRFCQFSFLYCLHSPCRCVAALLILSLRSNLSFSSLTICAITQSCSFVWVYVCSCCGLILVLSTSSHSYCIFLLLPMTSSLQTFTIRLMSLLKCLLFDVHFRRLWFPKTSFLISISALKCAWCAIASRDQPSLNGDMKPGMCFLSGCASWTA